MKIKSSNRLSRVPASPIRKLVPYANQAKQKGVHVYHLNIGDPDIETPKEMINVLNKWDKNPIAYGQSQGDPEFIESLLSYYHKLGFNFLETKNLQITSGGSEAISLAMFATTEPGDEILVFEPLYTNYLTYAVVNGITLNPVKTYSSSGFHLPTENEIEKSIGPKTRAILFCSPNNPTGTVYSENETKMLVRIAKKHHLFLLSDEVYREFTYDGRNQISLFSFMQEIPDQAIVLDSLSKRYSLCGARLGALVSLNQEVLEGALRIAQGRLSVGLVDQAMGAKLKSIPLKYFQKVNKEYENRRDTLYVGLKVIPGVTVPKPEGAFYVIAGLPVKNAEDFCKYLLTDFRDSGETVMLSPANGFYVTPGLGINEVRIAYVLSVPKLKRSLEIIRKALLTYPNKV
jgi:aspartate aminotransferase